MARFKNSIEFERCRVMYGMEMAVIKWQVIVRGTQINGCNFSGFMHNKDPPFFCVAKTSVVWLCAPTNFSRY